jgi:hypothetical protein
MFSWPSCKFEEDLKVYRNEEANLLEEVVLKEGWEGQLRHERVGRWIWKGFPSFIPVFMSYKIQAIQARQI